MLCAADVEGCETEVATRSQEGHIVRVVAGSCMQKGEEVFKALNSLTSFEASGFLRLVTHSISLGIHSPLPFASALSCQLHKHNPRSINNHPDKVIYKLMLLLDML